MNRDALHRSVRTTLRRLARARMDIDVFRWEDSPRHAPQVHAAAQPHAAVKTALLAAYCRQSPGFVLRVAYFSSRPASVAAAIGTSVMTAADRERVIVTGASTGIGEATALHLHQLGFSVLAGVRREEDAERLRGRGLTPFQLDVTVPAQLAAARAEIGDGPLAGIVNNAGIVRGGPLEFLPVNDLREQLEVSAVGALAVTQAFFAGLRAGRGRIVNIGSIQGRVARADDRTLCRRKIRPGGVDRFAAPGANPRRY